MSKENPELLLADELSKGDGVNGRGRSEEVPFTGRLEDFRQLHEPIYFHDEKVGVYEQIIAQIPIDNDEAEALMLGWLMDSSALKIKESDFENGMSTREKLNFILHTEKDLYERAKVFSGRKGIQLESDADGLLVGVTELEEILLDINTTDNINHKNDSRSISRDMINSLKYWMESQGVSVPLDGDGNLLWQQIRKVDKKKDEVLNNENDDQDNDTELNTEGKTALEIALMKVGIVTEDGKIVEENGKQDTLDNGSGKKKKLLLLHEANIEIVTPEMIEETKQAIKNGRKLSEKSENKVEKVLTLTSDRKTNRERVAQAMNWMQGAPYFSEVKVDIENRVVQFILNDGHNPLWAIGFEDLLSVINMGSDDLEKIMKTSTSDEDDRLTWKDALLGMGVIDMFEVDGVIHQDDHEFKLPSMFRVVKDKVEFVDERVKPETDNLVEILKRVKDVWGNAKGMVEVNIISDGLELIEFRYVDENSNNQLRRMKLMEFLKVMPKDQYEVFERGVLVKVGDDELRLSQEASVWATALMDLKLDDNKFDSVLVSIYKGRKTKDSVSIDADRLSWQVNVMKKILASGRNTEDMKLVFQMWRGEPSINLEYVAWNSEGKVVMQNDKPKKASIFMPLDDFLKEVSLQVIRTTKHDGAGSRLRSLESEDSGSFYSHDDEFKLWRQVINSKFGLDVGNLPVEIQDKKPRIKKQKKS